MCLGPSGHLIPGFLDSSSRNSDSRAAGHLSQVISDSVCLCARVCTAQILLYFVRQENTPALIQLPFRCIAAVTSHTEPSAPVYTQGEAHASLWRFTSLKVLSKGNPLKKKKDLFLAASGLSCGTQALR